VVSLPSHDGQGSAYFYKDKQGNLRPASGSVPNQPPTAEPLTPEELDDIHKRGGTVTYKRGGANVKLPPPAAPESDVVRTVQNEDGTFTNLYKDGTYGPTPKRGTAPGGKTGYSGNLYGTKK